MPGIFICRHPSHGKFDYQVSPYHVIQEKRCLKTGCVQFIWKCRIYAKDFRCPRGFRHVGKYCSSCKHYYEEKICRKPESLLCAEKLDVFWRNLDDYRLWLSMKLNRKIEFTGEIASIFPLLYFHGDGRHPHVKKSGYLIGFDKGLVGYELYADKIYLKISWNSFSKYRFAVGDKVEFIATLQSNRGRLIMERPTNIEIQRADSDHRADKSSTSAAITLSQATVGAYTGAIVEDDCRPCRGCKFGAFIEIGKIQNRAARRRRFFCLRGVNMSANCPVRLEKILHDGV